MPFISVPFLSCFICYFLGLFTGRWLAKVIDHKLGNRVATIIVFGLLIGMAMSPLAMLPFMMVEILKVSITGQGPTIFEGLNLIASSLFCPVCFIAGVLRPTVWGERW